MLDRLLRWQDAVLWEPQDADACGGALVAVVDEGLAVSSADECGWRKPALAHWVRIIVLDPDNYASADVAEAIFNNDEVRTMVDQAVVEALVNGGPVDLRWGHL